MKKKIFSTLLMVAFTLASTSMFVSCKDYDDDINQKADKSAVAALESTLNQLKADYEAFKAEAQRAHDSFATWTAHNALQEQVNGLDKAIKDLQAEIAALAKAADVETAIKNLQDQIDALKSNSLDQSALDKLAAELTALDNKYAEALKDYAKVSELEAVKNDLQSQIDALKLYEQKIEEVKTALEGKLDKSVFDAFVAGLGDTYYTKAQVDEIINNLKAQMGDETALNGKLEELRGLIEGVQGQLDTFKEEIEGKLAGVITAEQLQAVYDYANGELAKKADKTAVDNLEAFLNAFLSVIPDLPEDKAEQLKKFQEVADKLVNGVGRDINILNVMLSKRVTSVVFKAEFAALGRNAVEAPALAYQPHIAVTGTGYDEKYVYLVNKVKTNKEYDGAEMPVLHYPASYKEFRQNPWAVIADFTAIDHSTYAVPSKAYYHINPNSVDLSTATLSFVTNQFVWHEEVESRLTDKIIENWAVPTNPKASENPLSAAGVMEVEFTVDDWEGYIKQMGDNYMDTVPFNWLQKNVGHINTLVNEIALRVTDNAVEDEYKDVVSDYASVIPGMIHIQGLADNLDDNTYQNVVNAKWKKPLPLPVMPVCKQDESPEDPEKHLFKKAADAIDNGFTHQVAFDGFIDFDPYVEVHYTYMGAGNYSVENKSGYGFGEMEQTMSEDMFKRLGLSYRWTILKGYKEGKNVTDEGAHLEQDAEIPSKFYPRSVKANSDGTYETKFGETATREVIDREPVVKVELLDKFGNVIEVGYIKMKIVEDPTIVDNTPIVKEFEFGDIDFVNCGVAIERELNWAQMEDWLLGELDMIPATKGMTKEEFETEYEIVLPTDVKQFEKDKDGKMVERTKKIGEVEYKIVDPEDLQTNVIKWTVSDGSNIEDIYKLVEPVDGKSTKDLIVYIKFKSKVEGAHPDLYIGLKIPVGKLLFATGQIDDTKTLTYWFYLNSTKNVLESERPLAREVRVNVPTPAKSGETKNVGDAFSYINDNLLEETEFVKDLHDYFRAGTVKLALNDVTYTQADGTEKTVKGADAFPTFAGMTPMFSFTLPSTTVGNATFDASASGTWEVTGLTGKKYTLSLHFNETLGIYDEIRCGLITIVKLDSKGAVQFVEGDIADDILNYKGHNELGERETFTAYLKLTIPDACYPLDLKGTEWFNVRFVRPLDMVWKKNYEVVDAKDDWQTINLADLITVIDWRDWTGDPTNSQKGNSSSNKFDYVYYQIELLTVLNDILVDGPAGEDVRKVQTDPSMIDSYTTYPWTDMVGLQLKYEMVAGKPTLKYRNNSGITGDFHIFVPVYMQYVFGKNIYQSAWTCVTVKKSVNQETAKKH